MSFPLMPQDIEKARIFWMKATQAAFYSNELKVFLANSHLPNNHPLSRLTLFLGDQGIIRVDEHLN